jgi:hypothetical protein
MKLPSVRKMVMCWLVAGLGLGLLFGLAGCGRKQVQPLPLTPRPKPAVAAAPALPTAQEMEAAKGVVTGYLQALYDQKYEEAYNLLTEESQKRHPLEAFSKEAKATQVLYDLKGIKAEGVKAGEVKVTVPLQQEEEPGTKGFSVLKEQGKWKVAYISGKPFFPYAE